jgi:hypothetical protein
MFLFHGFEANAMAFERDWLRLDHAATALGGGIKPLLASSGGIKPLL